MELATAPKRQRPPPLPPFNSGAQQTHNSQPQPVFGAHQHIAPNPNLDVLESIKLFVQRGIDFYSL